jgi:hypothetical protein
MLCTFGYEIKINQKKSPHYYFLANLLILSLPIIISFNFLTSIKKVFDDQSFFKSPFIYSDKIHYYLKKYTPNQDDQVIFFTGENLIAFPLIKYAGKDNLIKSSTHFFYPSDLLEEANKYFNDQFFNKQLLESLQDPNYKLIIMGSRIEIISCQISSTEYFLRNSQFKKLLNNNFKYVGRIDVYKKRDDLIRKFKVRIKEGNYMPRSDYNLIFVLEIYARKTNLKK